MASKQMNIRIDEIHQELLEMLVADWEESKVKTNRTDIIQRSIYSYAKLMLGEHKVKEIVDKHLSGNKEG
jgi:hypothetical protein